MSHPIPKEGSKQQGSTANTPSFQQLERIRQAYRAELSTLTFNSKPIINALTKKADDLLNTAASAANPLGCAAPVVQAIQDHLANVIPKQKICFLYLIDSILKNVGRGYVHLFSRNLAATFSTAFHQLDPNAESSRADRDRFLRVLTTWRDGSIFPPPLLDQLEQACGIRAASSVSIPQDHPFSPQLPSSHSSGAQIISGPLIRDPVQVQLEAQLLALIQQKQQMFALNPSDSAIASQIPIIGQLLHAVQSTIMDPLALHTISSQIQLLYPSAPQPSKPHAGVLPTYPARDSFPFPLPAHPSTFSAEFNSSCHQALPGIFSSLDDLPSIHLTTEDINKPLKNAYTLLYEALPVNCNQCGARFLGSPSGKEEFRTHMDWHFRLNKRLKDPRSRRSGGSWRGWYISLDEWMSETEGISEGSGLEAKNLDKQKIALLFETAGKDVDVPSTMTAAAKPAPPNISAPESAVGSIVCKICKEVLEKFFDPDQEQWMLRNAIKVPGSAGDGTFDYYHFTCYEDLSLSVKTSRSGLTKDWSDLDLSRAMKRKFDESDNAAVIPDLTPLKVEKNEPE